MAYLKSATSSKPKYQIFSHTYEKEEGKIVRGDGWAMIDSRRVFEVDPFNPEQTLKLYQPDNDTFVQ